MTSEASAKRIQPKKPQASALQFYSDRIFAMDGELTTWMWFSEGVLKLQSRRLAADQIFWMPAAARHDKRYPRGLKA